MVKNKKEKIYEIYLEVEKRVFIGRQIFKNKYFTTFELNKDGIKESYPNIEYKKLRKIEKKDREYKEFFEKRR